MKKQITFIIFVFTILSTNSFAQFLTVYSGKEGTIIVKGQGTANGGTYTYEATIKSKFEAKILGEFWIYLSIPEFKITGFNYKGKDAAYFVDSSFPISPKGNFQSKISGDYRLSDGINTRIAGNSFVEGGVGQSMDMITFIDIDNDNKTALKQYLNGDKSKLANIKAQLSKLSLKNDYFEELSAIGRLIDKKIQNENQIKNLQKQENTVDNKTTKISNTSDDFWNGSASNSSSTITSTQTKQNSNKTRTSTNTSGLTSKQIKAHEDFKQKQQEQMQYMQAKIAESRQNAQNIQNAANATEMAWKNGNYIQGSSYLANEYARQGNESAAYGTIAVGVGLDIYSSIKADRERKKAQEAQQAQIDAERKRVEAEKKAYLESLVKKRRLVLTDILKYKYPKYSDDYGSTAYFYCFYMTDVNVGEWTPEVGITQVFEIPKYKDNTWPFQEATENKLKPYHKNPVNLIGGFKSYEDAAQSLTKLTTTFSETGVALTLIDVSKDFPNNTNVISNDSKSSAEQTDFLGNPAETKKTNTKSNKNSSSSNKKTKEDDFWGKSIKD